VRRSSTHNNPVRRIRLLSTVQSPLKYTRPLKKTNGYNFLDLLPENTRVYDLILSQQSQASQNLPTLRPLGQISGGRSN